MSIDSFICILFILITFRTPTQSLSNSWAYPCLFVLLEDSFLKGSFLRARQVEYNTKCLTGERVPKVLSPSHPQPGRGFASCFCGRFDHKVLDPPCPTYFSLSGVPDTDPPCAAPTPAAPAGPGARRQTARGDRTQTLRVQGDQGTPPSRPGALQAREHAYPSQLAAGP